MYFLFQMWCKHGEGLGHYLCGISELSCNSYNFFYLYIHVFLLGDYHQEHGNHDFKMWLDLWRGQVLRTIREATLRGQLTDKLVAMAPQGQF